MQEAIHKCMASLLSEVLAPSNNFRKLLNNKTFAKEFIFKWIVNKNPVVSSRSKTISWGFIKMFSYFSTAKFGPAATPVGS